MNAPAPYTLDHYIEDLRRISREHDNEDKIIGLVSPLARRIALEKSWLDKKYFAADRDQGFGVHVLHEEPDHTLAIFAVSWLPRRGTPPHDHGTWVVVAGVEGIECNVRYRRLDDASRPNYAELEVKQELNADEGDLVCMKSGGIHSVHNDTDSVTLSLHTYGKHVNYTVRSQYDLETKLKMDLIVSLE
jgi:predicted metal-dependent enzyme (double-stranded beta helix superfamily)